MTFEEFKANMLEFVKENFEVTNCRECHEKADSDIEPQDYKGSYDKALLEFYKSFTKYKGSEEVCQCGQPLKKDGKKPK